MVTGTDAIQILQKQVDYIATLKGLPFNSQQFKEWRYDTRVTLEKIFIGDAGRHKKEFEELFCAVVVASASGKKDEIHRAYQRYLLSAEARLNSIIKEIRDWGLPDNQVDKKTKNEQEAMVKPKPPKIIENILWIQRNGKEHWKLLLIALVVLGISIFYKFIPNLFSERNQVQHLETKANGNLSPATITSGPNSPVTNIYNLSGGDKNSKQSNKNKLQMTLRAICDDIDSRPLAQQDETAKKYVDMKMKIKRERLRVYGVEVNQGDPNIYDLEFIFPDEPDSPINKWIILCNVSKDIYPQLSIVRKGNDVYVNGEVQTTFRRVGDPYKCVVLSDVILEFE